MIMKGSSLYILIQLVIILLLTYGYSAHPIAYAFLLAAITYSATAMLLRKSIARHHRMGMRLVRQSNFKEAIPYFERSYKFFSKYKWVDKYRFLTLLSASGMPYSEMALGNLAFCYSQIGDGARAIEFYTKVLEENPNNGLAISGLRMLNSTKNMTT